MEQVPPSADQGSKAQSDQASKGSALARVFRSPDLRRVLPWLGLAAFLSNILALALPLGILQIMDRVVVNQSVSTLVFLVAGVLLALIVEELLRATNGLITSWLGARFEHKASVAALDRLMRVPLSLYQKEEPGVHAERILATAKVADFYSGQSLLVLFDLPFVLIFLALIYLLGGWVVLVPILLLLLFVLVIVHFGKWMRHQVEQRNTQDDRRYGFLAEVLSGIHTVKTMTMEALMQRRYERLEGANAELGDTLASGNALSRNIGTVFSQLMIVSVVFSCSWLVVVGKMTPGSLAACMMMSVRALQPLRRALTIWMRYQSFVAAQAGLDIIDGMPCENDEGKPAMQPVQDSIELRNIGLSRAGGGQLFSGLSCRIETGQCIAIRGASGSGKSTLMALISGLTQPDSGEVLVDGRPLLGFTAESIHREIALLPQNGTIVSGNILENLTMFDLSFKEEAIELSKKLGLDRIVSGMKLGYETPLGEGIGETLPAGVRQLITIIRGLVRGPSIVLFDEANISLDMRGDQLLQNYFAEQKGRWILVLVTHRPSLIALADTVYSLVDGRLVEGAVELDMRVSAPGEFPPPLPRPEPLEDLSLIVRRQFVEESDLARCVPALLSALDWQGKVRDLAEAMPHLERRMELSDLCSTLANLGLFPKYLRGDLSRIDPRLMPCLFVPEDREALVVRMALPDGNLLVFDSKDNTEREIEPVAGRGAIYIFQRSEISKKTKSLELSWLASMLQRFRLHIALGFVLTVVGAILSLAPPFFVRSVYGLVLPAADVSMGAYLLCGTLIAIGVGGFLAHLKGKIMAFVGGRTEYLLGNTIFQKVISLPTASIEGASISNQIGRIKNLESLRDFFLGPLSLVAFELPASLVLVTAIGIINPWALVVLLLSIVCFSLLGFFSSKIGAISANKASMLATVRWEFLNEALTDMRSIRAVGASRSWVNRFREMSGKAVMAHFRSQKTNSKVNAFSKILGSGTGFMVMAVSAYLAILGKISSGTMVATMMIVWRLVGPIQNIFMSANSIVGTRANLRQVENLMRLRGESDTGIVQTVRPDLQGTLTFARVSFRYVNDADPVLLGVSFTIKPGEFLVVAGGNGSGKSTLLKLIERVYVPQAGTIRIGNVDIRQLTASDLRSRISYMPQYCEIFYGTIAQNIRLVHPVASDEELEWAIEMAGLAEDIKTMPEGINTRISNNRSDQLPHGFRQCLSLARAILKPADFVLLDEPGTGMDQRGEDALMRCIEWLRGRSTLIMVSHRPGHMRLADTVIVMERGTVAAMGPFDSVKDKIMSGLR